MKTIAVLFALLLSGCALFQQPEQIVVTETIERPELILPTVDPLLARPVEWIVITNDNANDVFESLNADNIPLVLFGITPPHYENLSINTSNILQLVLQQRAIIEAYRRYYDQK